MRIYGDLGSGNCQKVKATAEFLGLAYDWAHVDIMKGESRTPAFLAMNPAGQIPLVVFDDGRILAQSNAIVRYLARGSSLIPAVRQLFVERFGEERLESGNELTSISHGLALMGAAPDLHEWVAPDGDQP